MQLEPGSLYFCNYGNFHRDKNPLLFVLYSDFSYTIGLNIHYIYSGDFNKLSTMFVEIENDRKVKNIFFKNNRRWYYDWLKQKYPEFIEQSFRVYHSPLLMGTLTNPLLRTQEIGVKWREPKTGGRAKPYKDLRQIASHDRKYAKLNKKIKFDGFVKSKIDSKVKSLKGRYKYDRR